MESTVTRAANPLSVVLAFDEAFNAHDVETLMSYYAGDAVLTLTPPPPGTSGVFSGVEQIRPVEEGFAMQNAAVESSDFRVEGDKVTWSARIAIDDWRRLGLAPLEFDTEATVREGKIKALTANITPESLARLQQALAGAQ